MKPPAITPDQQMGKQLTLQYQRAVNGMKEVLIFGAMLIQVEANLQASEEVSARGLVVTGYGIKDGGLKGWLEKFAPEIKRPTAYRFLGVTRAIVSEYESIVGARVAKTFSLPQLVLAEERDLSKHAFLKRNELFDYASGRSQRSWLDQFKGDRRSENGGKRERINGTKRRTIDEKEFDDRLDAALKWYEYGFRSLLTMHLTPAYTHLPDVELANVCDVIKLISKTAEAACRERGIVPSQVSDWDK